MTCFFMAADEAAIRNLGSNAVIPNKAGLLRRRAALWLLAKTVRPQCGHSGQGEAAIRNLGPFDFPGSRIRLTPFRDDMLFRGR